MLAQSYMPAQETQILINPFSENESPWYFVDECIERQAVRTPQWTFDLEQLKRFKEQPVKHRLFFFMLAPLAFLTYNANHNDQI